MEKLKYRMNLEVLDSAMKQKNLNNTQLAKVCGVTQPCICGIVRGRSTPSILLLKKISDALDIPTNELVMLEAAEDENNLELSSNVEISSKEFIEKYGWDAYVSILTMRKFAEHRIYDNRPTSIVYEMYAEFCQNKNATPIFCKIEFSKAVVQYLGYWIQDVKVKGHKYRVFRKIENNP